MKPDAAAYGKPDALTATAPSKFADLAVLTKLRLNSLVVAAAAAGYYMGADVVEPSSLVLACLGTGFVAGGAAAINQVDERDIDLLMERTRQRPMPAGRMRVAEARAVGYGLGTAGLLMLWMGSNALAALVALGTFVIYTLVYTPLKRRTSLSTIIGAVPGALPPIIGWAAARGSLAGPEPWSLFVIMFFWQLPHFLAISWMCREDYGRAGLRMLAVIDRDGAVVGRQAALWAAALVPFTQLPLLLGMADIRYGVGALVLGVALFWLAVKFAAHRSLENARLLFYGSILYLPLLLGLMAFTGLPRDAAPVLRLVQGSLPAAAPPVPFLPTLNATLNATSAVLLTTGYFFIRSGNVRVHRRFMLSAFVSSSLFLISYVVYHAQAGSKHFPGTGLARTLYFSILIPHVTLAAVVLPLAILTLRRGLVRDDVAHRRIAIVTLPIWLFVSVTGVIVYLMLYRLY